MSRTFSQTEQPSSQEYVSPETMQTYAETLIAEYNSQINHYFPTMKNDFYFYSNSSYTIKSYISSQYGASLWIEPSSAQFFENFNVSQSVETAVFGGDSSLFPLFAALGDHIMISGGFYELNGHPMVKLSNVSSVIFENVTVIQPSFQQHYTFVLMKGNNQTSNWTSEMAKEDAGEILYIDMGVEFSVSEAVRQRYAEPELTALLQNIQSKLKNDSSYTASDWLADMKNIENIAITKYHLSNPTEFINEMIAFLNAKTTGILPTWPQPTPSPTPTQRRTILGMSDPDNWIYATLFGSYLVFVYALFLILRAIQKKYPNEDLKFLSGLLLDGVLIAVGVGFLVLNYPYDSHLAIPQIILVFGISIFGIIGLYKAKKKLATWRLTRANNAKSPHKETQEKTNPKKPTKSRDNVPTKKIETLTNVARLSPSLNNFWHALSILSVNLVNQKHLLSVRTIFQKNFRGGFS